MVIAAMASRGSLLIARDGKAGSDGCGNEQAGATKKPPRDWQEKVGDGKRPQVLTKCALFLRKACT